MDWNLARQVAERIATQSDSDVILYNGKIEWRYSTPLVSACESSKNHKNVLLVLVTFGGDADAAYRIARYLRATYERFTVFTPSYCKSAGTILVIGATELAMSGTAELGPLDIQMSKPDELDETRSSFIINDAFAALQSEAIELFIQSMRDLKKKTGANVTLKTAMPIAADLTGSLFSGVYSQIDPMHVGEAYRASRVALEYAKRLSENGLDLSEDTITALVSGYPSHSFVIDRAEAQNVLGKNVRNATADELELAKQMGWVAQVPWPAKQAWIEFISLTKQEHDEATKQSAAPASSQEPAGIGESGGGDANAGAQVTPFPKGS